MACAISRTDANDLAELATELRLYLENTPNFESQAIRARIELHGNYAINLHELADLAKRLSHAPSIPDDLFP